MFTNSMSNLLIYLFLNAENIKEQQRLAVFTKSLLQEHNKQL